MIIDTEFNSAAQIPADICIDAAVEAEQRGFGAVWKGESNSRDPMVLLTAMAMRTSSVRLGTAIHHLYARSPVAMAIQAATFNEVSGGRLILGLGVGNPIIAAWHGQEYSRPLGRLREYVEIMRAAYSGEKVPDRVGDFYGVSRGFKMSFTPAHPLEVWVAGLGPQMSRLAGRISDGIVINIANPPIIKEIIERARAGAREAGRDPDSVQAVAKVRVSLHEDVAVARSALKKVLTFYSLQNGYGEVLTQMGFGDVVTAVREKHRAAGFSAARAQIPDEMLEVVPMYAGTDLTGLPHRLADYEQAGATRCVVAYVPAGGDLQGEVAAFLAQASAFMTGTS